jgi:cobalt-precorrin 5A hydrolase
MKGREYIVGIGCRRGVSLADIESAFYDVLNKKSINIESVKKLASIDIKSDESGLLSFAKKFNLEISFFSKDQLKSIDVPTPSEMVQSITGTGSVCEAAAILAGRIPSESDVPNKINSNPTLIVEKQKYGNTTIAIVEKVKT